MSDLAELLQAPFAAEDIEWRPNSWGKGESGYWVQALAYVTNRAIQQRLDEAVGPEFWKNEFREWHTGGVDRAQLCGISILTGDNLITKWDGAECTQIEAIKGGLSDSMKRAAVQWGIGRYLYKLDVTFAQKTSQASKPHEHGWKRLSAQDEKGKSGARGEWHTFWWLPPVLPDWALPTKKPHSKAMLAAIAMLDQCSDYDSWAVAWRSLDGRVRAAIKKDEPKLLNQWKERFKNDANHDQGAADNSDADEDGVPAVADSG